MASDTTARELNAAKISALMNGRYHADREAFLDGWHRWFMFAVILLGASALVETLPPSVRILASVLTAALGAIDLVFSLSVRARAHSYLREAYFEIAASLKAGSMNSTKAEAQMLRLAAKEEPIYCALHAHAENWATRAVIGFDKPLSCRVPFWKSFLRNVCRFSGSNFSTIS